MPDDRPVVMAYLEKIPCGVRLHPEYCPARQHRAPDARGLGTKRFALVIDPKEPQLPPCTLHPPLRSFLAPVSPPELRIQDEVELRARHSKVGQPVRRFSARLHPAQRWRRPIAGGTF
ncbi:hypothetical protein D3C80_1367370 [compost metagenome]